MTRIVHCIDCDKYQSGGFCRKKKKETSPLKEACEWAKKNEKLANDDVADVVETTEDPATEQEPAKCCKKCGRTLPLSSFSANHRTPDGLQSNCKDCMRESIRDAQSKRIESLESKKAHACDSVGAPIVGSGPKKSPMRGPSVKDSDDRILVEELRSRGWTVTCERPKTIIESI